MDDSWEANVARCQNFDIGGRSEQDIEDFVDARIYVHKRESFTDEILWETFQEEFANFQKADFTKMPIHLRQKIRIHLLQRGVWVKQPNKEFTLADALREVITRTEKYVWSDEDIEVTLEKVDKMHTKALRKRLDPTMTSLRKYMEDQGQVKAHMQDQNTQIRAPVENTPDQIGNQDQFRKHKCYVCQKESCGSWRHSREEIYQTKEQYRERYERVCGKGTGFSGELKQYMGYCEGAQPFEVIILDKRRDVSSEASKAVSAEAINSEAISTAAIGTEAPSTEATSTAPINTAATSTEPISTDKGEYDPDANLGPVGLTIHDFDFSSNSDSLSDPEFEPDSESDTYSDLDPDPRPLSNSDSGSDY